MTIAMSVRDVFLRKWDPGKPAVLIIGDSTAATSINAAALQDAFSLPLLNGTSVEAYFALRKWLSTQPKPKCIVTMLSQNWPDYKIFFWKTFVRTGFYDREELEEIWRESRAVDAFPGTSYEPWAYFASYVAFRSRLAGLTMTELQESIFASRAKQNTWARDWIRRFKGSFPLGEKSSAPLRPAEKAPHGEVERLFELYNKKYVDLAVAAGIKVFFLRTLEPSGQPSALPEVSRARQEEIVRWVREKGSAEVIEPGLTLGESDFSWPFHPNRSAALRVTKEIGSRIQCR